MTSGRASLVLGSLLAALHCAPQTLDAVDAANDAAGAGNGATAGTAGSGGGACSGACCAPADADRDADGVPDCEDGCPDQPDKIEPGVCGCELPDEDRADVAGCLGLLRSLRHRYAFEGSGTRARDTASLAFARDPELEPADGVLVNTALTGTGTVLLDGGMNGIGEDDQFVALPSGLVSALSSVTLEAWLIWYGGREWQRVFDFGSSDAEVEGEQGSVGVTYLFLTTSLSSAAGNRVRVAYKRSDYSGEVRLDSVRLFPRGILTHVAVVFDQPNDTLSLYLDGALERSLAGVESETGIPLELARLEDVNAWLGRSQFGADAELGASYEEFRIYDQPLSALQIRTSAIAGPSPAFLPGD